MIWHNVWNPTNPWDFVNPEPTKPNFSATDEYYIDCGLHWRNFLPWVLGISGVNIGSPLPGGITVTGSYEPTKGLQPETCPLTATAQPTGILYTWTASGWSSRSRAQLYVYNTLTQELVFQWNEIETAGSRLWTAEIGVSYTALVREENDGSGEKKYGQAVSLAIYDLTAFGTNGQGFTITLTRIPAGTASFQWNASNSQACTMLSLSNTGGTLQTATAIFESA